MAAMRIWIAGYGGPPAAAIGAIPVWIATGDGSIAGATEALIDAYGGPFGEATAVWIAGYGGPPPAAIGATPITIVGYGGSGGGGSGGSTSVWSAADAAASSVTLSNGGLTVTPTTAGTGYGTVRTTNSKTTGKLYIELLNSGPTLTAVQLFWGLANAGFSPADYLGDNPISAGVSPGNGTYTSGGGFAQNYVLPSVFPAANDVWSIAVDFSAGRVWMAQNNVWANSSNPATGLSPMLSFTPATAGALFAAISLYCPNSANLGVWTLQATAASQKYAPPSGFVAWDGGVAPAHSAEALAYLARTVGGNEGGNGANIATLIDGLVSDGVWAKLDALYVLAQQNQSDALLNLIGTSYGLTSVGFLLAKPAPFAVNFTPYVGFSGFPTGRYYLDTGFNPATAPSPHFTQNSASLGYWSYALTAANNAPIGNDESGAGGSYIFQNYGPGSFYARINNVSIGGVPTPGSGLFVGDRSSSASVTPYWNGGALTVQSGASSAVSSANFRMGVVPGDTASPETISAAFIGASLGAAGQLALYNRLRTYMTAVGVP
jgi:hypothetical protein